MEDMETNSEENNKTWVGTSISSLCKEKGPWSFSITPIVLSKYHYVLYELPATLKEPPKPYAGSSPKDWQENYVRMPYSKKNLFPVTENGVEVPKLRWNLIKDSLSQPINNSKELESAVFSYNSALPQFYALHFLFEEVLEEEETQIFFTNLLPKIIKLALRLPELLPCGIPLLKKNFNRSLSLSQHQISCILANAFLCTFPWGKEVAGLYPGINFGKLFNAYLREKRRNCVSEKLKCLFNYFRRVTDKVPVGVVTFERRFIQRSNLPRWDTSDLMFNDVKIHVDSKGTIEDDGLGFLQVDFANKNVGGGVLAYGCVQEEIRFVICPELIVSRLFVEQLDDQEAVIVIGPERYNNYSGYGDTFRWSGNVVDTTPYDEYGRRRTSICIIDATYFNKPVYQFYQSAMLREINKAYCGFSSREKDNLAPVATGNWGCGAFRGNACLKALLQLMACIACGRDLVYYTFGDEELRDKIYSIYLFLSNHKVTISQLWRFLSLFSSSKNIAPDNLYSFIQQAYFDSQSNQKQPKIKSFFGVTFKKKTFDVKSTSETSKKLNNSRDNVEKFTTSPTDDDDEDVIPGTPEEITKNEKTVFRSKPKVNSEDIVKKLPKTNIIELIEAIDGNKTLQNSINKGGNSNSDPVSDWKAIEDSFNINVDVNTKAESGAKSASTSNETKTSKRKLTDYFQKPFKPS